MMRFNLSSKYGTSSVLAKSLRYLNSLSKKLLRVVVKLKLDFETYLSGWEMNMFLPETP